MRKLILLALVFKCSLCISQVNKILESTSPGHNTTHMYEVNDGFAIPTIFIGDYSEIILFDEDSQSNFLFEDFDFCFTPCVKVEENLYCFGDIREIPKSLELAKINSAFEVDWRKDVTSDGFDNFPMHITKFGDGLALVIWVEFPENKNRFQVAKLNLEGETEWQIEFDQDANKSYPFSIAAPNDTTLIVAAGIFKNTIAGRHLRLRSLKPNGTTKWVVNYEEEIMSLSNKMAVTILQNGEIVLFYEVNKWNDEEFDLNTFTAFPYQLLWFDSEGNLIREREILLTNGQKLTYHKLLASNDGNFFGYGSFNGSSSTKAIITKFNTEGDTIWTRRIERPEYADSDEHGYFVKSMIELDNGNLLA